MRVRWRLAAGLLLASCLYAESDCLPQAPCYSETSIVNAASFFSGALAPNAWAAVFGSNLAYSTRALRDEDIQGGRLPIQLAGVTVRVGPLQAPISFVSPEQINVLVPGTLMPGSYDLQVVRDGRAGPIVRVAISDAAPALFQVNAETVVASHLDYSLVTGSRPALPGQFVVLWVNGLGPVIPPLGTYTQIPVQAAWIQRIGELRILLDGAAVDQSRVQYAGVTPGCAGLYQVNVRLPEGVGSDPEIRIAVGEQVSPPSLRVPVRP